MPWSCCWSPMPEPRRPASHGDPVADLPFAYGGPVLDGCIREAPEDFQVEEILGFPPDGRGDYLFLRVEKRCLNTMDVVRQLARWAGVSASAVGFSGLKDRRSLAVQHFTIRWPAQDDPPDTEGLAVEGLRMLALSRHRAALIRGSLQGNEFTLRLTRLQGDAERAQHRLIAIRESGFPNYFGTQRFGNDGSNLAQARLLLSGRLGQAKPEQRRMLLSAARSHVFNQVLAARVRDGSWNRLLPGEVLVVQATGRQLIASSVSQKLQERLQRGEIHPGGPLPGRPGHCLQAEGEVAALEAACLQEAHLQAWADALGGLGLNAGRRALRVLPAGLVWEWRHSQRVLELRFRLPAGTYATSLVRELARFAR